MICCFITISSMAGPGSIVPYKDHHESSFDIDYLSFFTDSIPTLPVFPSNNEPQPEPFSFTQVRSDHNNYNNDNNVVIIHDNIADPDGPFNDPIFWDMYKESNNGQSQEAGPSQFRGQTSNPRYEGILHDGRPVEVWPPPTVPFCCSFCQVLREIIHTDGKVTTKLEIHGRMGVICHAVLENRHHVMSSPSDPKYHMFDFCKRSIEDVNQFLQQYCEERKLAGYLMVKDPLSMFYQTLCVGLEWAKYLYHDDFFDVSPTASGERQMDQSEEAETERMRRSNLSQQRERAGKLTLKDFEGYFHLPIEEAARRLNLCPTVVKKICRRHGMTRWPHRKVKSLQRQISNVRELLNSNDAEERARAVAEIQRLEEEIDNICTGATG